MAPPGGVTLWGRLLVMERRGADWSDQEWLDEARRIRQALAALDDHLPRAYRMSPERAGRAPGPTTPPTAPS
ncbi:hypothetical protein [Streptomyces cyaneofuscatus]|uniref:hypothetical protein n=1 Tax=Streptomyces cyaneofuscatus TaxID=66883 RepID=UPI00379863EB